MENDDNKSLDSVITSIKRNAQEEIASIKEEYAKILAHEIKNPLTPMKLRIQITQRKIEDNTIDWQKDIPAMMDSLLEGIDMITKIADDYAIITKSSNIEMSIISGLHIIAKLKAFTSSIPFVNIDFDIKDECKFSGNENHLLRVLMNLIRNSDQAISAKKEIIDEINGQIKVSLSCDKQNIIFSVSDNGIGIKEEDKDHIFDQHFTTKKSGSGLGLPLSKAVVESMNGTIEFESEFMKGTTFRIKFPKSN